MPHEYVRNMIIQEYVESFIVLKHSKVSAIENSVTNKLSWLVDDFSKRG